MNNFKIEEIKEKIIKKYYIDEKEIIEKFAYYNLSGEPIVFYAKEYNEYIDLFNNDWNEFIEKNINNSTEFIIIHEHETKNDEVINLFNSYNDAMIYISKNDFKKIEDFYLDFL